MSTSKITMSAINAAWAIKYGKPMPPPPKGVSQSRWLAMVQQAQRHMEENS